MTKIAVLFVGDAPTTSQGLIGKKALATLKRWQQYLFINPEEFNVALCGSNDKAHIKNFQGIIIALGYDAGLRVKALKQECYHLPDPAPGTDLVYDAAYEMEQLRRCKQFIYTKVA